MRHDRAELVRGALAAEGLDGVALEVLGVRSLEPSWVRGANLRRGLYLAWQYRAVRAVLERVRRARERGSVVIHHVTFATEAIPTFEWMLNGPGVTRVFGPAGSSQTSDGRDCGRSIRRAFRRRAGALNLRDVALFVAQNDDVALQWAELGNRVSVEPAIVIRDDELMRARLAARHYPKGIVVVGHLVTRKRPELAIQSVLAMGEEATDLYFIGDGPERHRLASAYAEHPNIHFLGRVPRDEALARIAGADALLLTSDREGAPWVVGEAQALGTPPVVISRCGGDTLVRLAGGEVVERPAPHLIAASLKRALANDFGESDRWSERRFLTLLTEWYARQR